MKSLHVDHGNPLNSIRNNSFTQMLYYLGKDLDTKIKRVIIMSAHFLSHEYTIIGTNENPGMIYDMSGFPDELYQVKYPVQIDISSAHRIWNLLEKNGIKNVFDGKMGIDHGIWSVLLHLFPHANIPIIPISVCIEQGEDFHYSIGRLLESEFWDDTLFISSGNIVHNLSLLSFDQETVFPWAASFDEQIERIITSDEKKKIIDYKSISGWDKAAPTPDHFFPFITFAWASEGKQVSSLHKGFELGNISLRIYKNF